MAWFTLPRLRNLRDEAIEEVDISSVVAESLTSRQAAREGLQRLLRHRDALHRQRKVLEKQFRRPTPVRVRNMARSGTPMGTYQLQHEMRQANDLAQDSGRNEQVASIEERIREVDHAIAQLRKRIARP